MNQSAGYSLGVMTIGTIFCNKCGTQNLAPPHNSVPSVVRLSRTRCQSQTDWERLMQLWPRLRSLSTYNRASVAQPAVGAPTGYCGFWIRFVAAIIDGIIVQAVVTARRCLLWVSCSASLEPSPTTGRQVLAILAIWTGVAFGLFASWLYEAAMESSSKQATLGKMVLGMKVTDLQGNRISFARATVRHFCKYHFRHDYVSRIYHGRIHRPEAGAA